MKHYSIMVDEILSYLDIQPSDMVFDGTLGLGGHSEHFLSQLKEGQLFATEVDKEAYKYCQDKFKTKATLFNQNFSTISELKESHNLPDFNKLCLDLGFSSFQLDDGKRGFSFTVDEPLDLRMNQNLKQSASDIVNSFSEKQLSDMFYTYGELHQNKILSKNIVISRKKKRIKSTFDLIEIIKKSYKIRSFKQERKIFSQVFQALRIEVNQELEVLKTFLENLDGIMASHGRIAILTFHSIEDRLVKQFFKAHKDIYTPLTKHVVTATREELKENSRSKPAKLRVYEKK